MVVIHMKEELESIDGEVQQVLLTEAMESLSDDDYLIVKLFYLEESSVKDISTVTGLSQANVKVKLHRIRKKLYCNMKDSIGKVVENIVNL